MFEQTKFHQGELRVSDIMTDAATVTTGTPLFEIAAILSKSRYRHVLVNNSDGRLLGVISSRDVLRQMSDALESNSDWTTKTVESAMITKFMASTPEADARDLATMIASGSIQCVPVLEGEKLVGVLTPDDLLMSLNRLDPVLREAGRDALTGVANRATFDQRLGEEWERAKRQNGGLGLILIDVDKFKDINDTCGHNAGDAVLQMIGACLTRHLRAYDVVARYGGDEFVAICSECDWETIGVPIERLQTGLKNLSIPVDVGRQSITLSIGAAVVRDGFDAHQAEDLVVAADAALYQAKRAGRDRAYRVELSREGAEVAEPFLVNVEHASAAPR